MPEPSFTFLSLEELIPTQARNAMVLEYWKGLRGQDKLPKWSAFDPLDITQQLTSAMILHCESKDISRIILYGTTLVETLGIDLTGVNFLDVFKPEERQQSADRTYAIRSRPAAGLAHFVGQTASGGPFKAEFVVLPFINDDGTIDRMLLSVAEYVYERDNPNSVFTLDDKNFDDYRFYDL